MTSVRNLGYKLRLSLRNPSQNEKSSLCLILRQDAQDSVNRFGQTQVERLPGFRREGGTQVLHLKPGFHIKADEDSCIVHRSSSLRGQRESPGPTRKSFHSSREAFPIKTSARGA